MLDFVKKYSGGQYSQNGEAGIIDECLRRLDWGEGIAVEFGAPTKEFCSNIFHLTKIPTWRCFYFDPNPQEEGIDQLYVTPENVNKFIPECDVLSIDVDSIDYSIWKAYTGKPAIVIIEINSSISPTDDEPVNSMQDGTAYKPMCELAIEKGYFVLCHTGNIIAVDNQYRSLFPEVTGDPVKDHHLYFNTSWL